MNLSKRDTKYFDRFKFTLKVIQYNSKRDKRGLTISWLDFLFILSIMKTEYDLLLLFAGLSVKS